MVEESSKGAIGVIKRTIETPFKLIGNIPNTSEKAVLKGISLLSTFK